MQNSIQDEPGVIHDENAMQPRNNNNNRRMKWSKEINENVIRCYFNTILRLPDQPYRKEFHRRWKELYPNLQLTEQRICDQQRVIVAKSNTNQNIRGNWLTQLEIIQIRGEIQQQIVAENQNENNVMNNEHERENNEEQQNINLELLANQPNPLDEDEITELKRKINDKYARSISHSLKTESLDHLVYAAAITAIH